MMSMGTATIYALIDPRTDSVRYVGVAKDPVDRLRAHMRDGGEGVRRKRTHKACWIRSLRRLGLRPVLRILARVSEQRWEESERKWIAKLRRNGDDLTNANDGGYGMRNPTPQTRAKMSAAARRRPAASEETRSLLSKLALGRKLKPRRPEHAKAISDALRGRERPEQAERMRGRKVADQTRERMSEGHKKLPGKHWDYLRGKKLSAEHRAKIAAGVRGKTRYKYPPMDQIEAMAATMSLRAISLKLGIPYGALWTHMKANIASL